MFNERNTRFSQNVFSKERTLLYFGVPNVNNIVYCGKAVFNKATSPIGQHTHGDCFEFTYHVSGRQIYGTENDEYLITAGDIFVAHPHEVHSSKNNSQEISKFYYVCFFFDREEEKILGLSKQSSRFIIDSFYELEKKVIKGDKKMERLFEDFMKSYFDETPMRADRIHYHMAELLFHLISLAKVAETEKVDIPKDITEAIKFIDRNSDKKISLDELAVQSNISLPYFKKRFRTYVGMSPYNYILRQKTKAAKLLLKNSDTPIVDIAFELGFSSSQHFSTIFKKYEYLTPQQYRKSKR